MRILLVQPPYDLFDDDERQAMPPLGLAYVGAVLEREGHEVKIVDCVAEGFHRLIPLADGRRRHGLDGDDLGKVIGAFAPAVLGVSCLFSAQSRSAHDVCRLAKGVDPGLVTVMGGAHPSAVPEEVLEDPNVNFAVLGEGELTMLQLVRAVEDNRPWPSGAKGLAFRRDGAVIVNKPGPYLRDLDSLPLPARHLLPMDRYFKYRSPHGCVVRRHPCTNVITSRGCPGRCCFCSIHTVWGRKFRCHGVERVIHELETLVSEYGVREVQFEDDNLTLHKRRMADVCRAMIDRRVDLTWTTPNGASIRALDEELIGLMREAGCYHVTIAVESGSQQVLDRIIHKALDLRRVRPIVRACREVGMGISAFFVVGFPGETKADMEKTFDFGLNLGADHVHFYTATPYPGTALFRECLDRGILRRPVDYSQLRIGHPIISTPEWTAAELGDMTRAAQARFYRQAAVRQPVRFLSTVARKFAREPAATLRKARAVLWPAARGAGATSRGC